MKRGGRALRLTIMFLVVLLFYLAAFYGIERARTHKGPWEVTFQVTGDGAPAIQVEQRALGISQVSLAFPGEGPVPVAEPFTVRFDAPGKTNIPFGRVLFLDPTFLPGTVTLDLFGHEIELLPRVLVLNKEEIPWASHTELLPDPGHKTY